MIKSRIMPADLTWDWVDAGPATQGWRVDEVGDMLFTGAQYPVDDMGEVIGPGDILVQTEVVFSRLEELLRAAGSDWDHVVRINTFYLFDGDAAARTEYWVKMTEVRDRFAPNPGGHSGTGVIAHGLPGRDVLITASLIATLP